MNTKVLFFICVSVALWPGALKSQVPDVIEGDILVPRSAPKALFTTTGLWPNGRVPYVFSTNVSASEQAAMFDAMGEWEAVANVDFLPRSSESDYLFIQKNGWNNSFVGRQGGPQEINILNWNSKWVMVHELAHALGFWHEQSRADRTNYISVNLANVDPWNVHNFDIHTEASHYGPYDFDSLMHYGVFDFSKDGQQVITILPPYDAQWQWYDLGHYTHLSVGDRQTMAFLYPYPEPPVALVWSSNHTARLSFLTVPGLTYTIQASTNLVDWSPVWTTNAPTQTTLFEDLDAVRYPRRFYRIVGD